MVTAPRPSGPKRLRGAPRVLSPVLLLGAGTGEATCGILYLASYLRRHGVEAFVQLTSDELGEAEVRRSLRQLLGRVKPKVVGISLKWFHHLARALLLARLVRDLAPGVRVVLGGNSATFYARELLGFGDVDDVILGDGEAPLLALCRQVRDAPNVLSRDAPRAGLSYVQGTANVDVHYSHFDELFLSGLDRASFSGWVAPGKGCGENCLYCGGTRGMQKATFGRALPFLRTPESVRLDHQAIVGGTWQLRYDFAGSTSAFLEQCWEGVDLSRHATTYFLWGVPPESLMATLARHFERAHLVVDIGCFAESQRRTQLEKGLLKPCAMNDQLFAVVSQAKAFPNLDLEITGIAGLPFATAASLREETALVERLLSEGCRIGYQRLESQPGALVTEHPERFGMVSEARSFHDFLDYFEQLEPGAGTVPMVRYADPGLEAAVARTAARVEALISAQQRRASAERRRTRAMVQAAPAARDQVALSDWLGPHRVPAKLARAPVTVIRSVDGLGLACAPTVQGFEDPALLTDQDAALLLGVLDAFSQPARRDAGLARLPKGTPKAVAADALEHLLDGHFVRPV
ncbi:MAG: cobalamin-dependent protein [Myxococcaceae bacterium]|nr:cobalamin-dependent protein [Myxococcaceae bacterium]